MPDNLYQLAALVTAIAVIGGATLFCWRISKTLNAITEGVLGKGPVTDRSGAVIEEAVPSLQARVSSLETMMSNATTETRLSSGEARLSALESWRESHTREATEVAQRLLDHTASHGNQ